MPSTSTYKNLTVPTNLGDAGLWGGYLNTTIGLLDALLGGPLVLQSSASPAGVTLTSTQAANLAYQILGALGQNYTLTFTSSLGGYGLYVIDNQTTGSFSVNVTQTSSATSAVTIPQGGRSLIYGDGLTFRLADNNQTAKLYSYLGTPQGNVAGTAATANGGATDEVRDVTNQIDYACKTTGVSSAAQWIAKAGLPPVGGYLTASTDASNPVPSGDLVGVSSVFWTPFSSNWCWASDGTAVFPVQFSRTTLTLTNTNNAASQLQDVFFYWNSNSPVIGTGPTWAAGSGGSVTAGSCARGTGAGGTALSRLQGAWTNAVQVTINNGASSYVVPANQGIYLGSVFIDTAAGQVTCHRTYGQSRKWGVWSAFNAQPIYLKAGDSTASWTYSTNTLRASNGNSANSLSIFQGLAQSYVDCNFTQQVGSDIAGTAPGQQDAQIAIGFNSTTVASGTLGAYEFNNSPSSNLSRMRAQIIAIYKAAPALGINTVTALEKCPSANSGNFGGTESLMLLQAGWFA